MIRLPHATRLIFGLAIIAALAGCASLQKLQLRPSPPTLPEYASPAAPSEMSPPASAQTQAPVSKQDPDRLVYYKAIVGSLSEANPEDDPLSGRTLSLAFVNAPVADVARAVLAEALGQPLTIADGVSGAITLTAAEPVAVAEALTALETVLAESGLALVKTNFGFLLTTTTSASAAAQPLRNAGSGYVGYGVTIVPIKFAAPGELAQLIDPFISDRLTITIDEERSALLLRGAQAEVVSAIDAIAAFDTPYLTDRTFGMFKLRYADAETIREEIITVLDAAVAGGGSQAELIALPRLNLLFVTARTIEGFREARAWIERLDQPSGGDERRLRYYAVQNTPAEALADQLNTAFGGRTFSANAGPTNDAGGAAVQPTFRRQAPPGGNGDRATISTDELNNALIIRATDQEYREILDLVARMDVQSPQVLIEATIAEVTLNDDLSYGIRWFFENAESTVTLADNALGAVGPVFPGLSYTYFDTNVQVALNTLASVTDVSVLSTPSIMVLNNQSANLQVGDEVPVVTQTAQSVVDQGAPIVSTVQLRETGVILEVKPRINASDIVVLEVTQEVSDVVPTTTSGIDSPTIRQRKFTSTVAVKNNGTVALGGLIRETYTDNQSGVPVLKDIPGLGYAFKSRDITKRRTELIIFLTPRIIRSDADAQNAIKFIRREMHRLADPDTIDQ
jgi:general secretion pathway protein D